MKQNFQELQSRLSDYQHIYTDGSKVEDKVGCAYLSGSHHEKFVCVEVLRPSQPNGVMSSAVSLPNHTFTGQA